VSVCGVLQIHSAPPALCPHIEWAVAGVVGVPVRLPWVNQPASPASVRAEIDWHAAPGTAAAVASALAGWKQLRFEVTEQPSPGCDGTRYSYTPSLGLFSATVSANGDVLVSENRLRDALTVAEAAKAGTLLAADARHPAAGGCLETELRRLLGEPWDAELEPFRQAAAGAPVRWLHATG
jgi:hypothetical protein